MRTVAAIIVLAVAIAADPAHAQAPLERYGVDPDRISVSGLSSGGYMAVQLAIAHSATFTGVGVLAAGPFACADTGGSLHNNATRAVGPCMAGRYGAVQRWFCTTGFASCLGADQPDVARSLGIAQDAAREQRIDPLSHLERQRVFLLSGDADKTVDPSVVDALEQFFRALVPSSRIARVRRSGLAHTFPTMAFREGNACEVSASPFVSDCGYDGAQRVLEHVHGPLGAAREHAAEKPIAFDQRPFFPPGTNAGMAMRGHVYVPAACKAASARCGLHVALHGCSQTEQDIGTTFVDEAGYNRWADANRLIVLYPQARKTPGAFSDNPKGCWDWWGYTGAGWHDKRAPQMRAIIAMIERLKEPASP